MKTKFCDSFLILIILSLSAPLLISQAPATKTETKPAPVTTKEETKVPEEKKDVQTSKESAKNPEDVTWRDILEYTRAANDNTLATSTQLVEVVGVVAGIIALGLGIASYLSIRRFDSIRKELNIKLIEANDCLKVIQNNQAIAEKALLQIDEFVDKLKQAVRDAQEKAGDLSKIDISSDISRKVEARLNDFARKTDFAEFMGIRLEPESYFARGNSFYQRALYEEALKEYLKAIELKPDFMQAWHNKAVTFAILGLQKEALDAFNKVIELGTKDGAAFKGKGDALIKLGLYEEAVAAYDKAIQLDPDYDQSYYGKGSALFKLGLFKEACPAFSKAIDIKPNDAKAWYKKACCLSLMKNKQKTLKSLTEVIRLSLENKHLKYLKYSAKEDKDFAWLWEDPDFKKLFEDEAGATGSETALGK